MSIKIKINNGKAYDDKSQGFCPKCQNHSLQLGDIGVCPACDAEAEKRIVQPPDKGYIKAGKRGRVGL